MLRALPPQNPPREPIFNIPAVVVIAIGVLVLLHGVRLVLAAEADTRLLLDLAFIPAQWTVAWNPAKATDIMVEIAGQGADPETALRLSLARYFLSDPDLPAWTVLTYAL